MPKSVLIIGNGVSRKQYSEFIKTWDSEIWACNRAFLEIDSFPRLDRLTGDSDAIIEAIAFRKKTKAKFTIYLRSCVYHNLIDSLKYPKEEVNEILIPDKFQKDSGTTLVAMAYIEGYTDIKCLGFDLGGKDLYVKHHETRNKSNWISNWRRIFSMYSPTRMEFIGKDHKPVILSNKPETVYARLYLNGKDHLQYEEFEDQKLKRSNKVLILGNGCSRLALKQKIFDSWKGEVWVCNAAYQEHLSLPRLDRVGTVHDQVALQADIYRKKNNLKFLIFSKNYNTSGFCHFAREIGWSTGNLMIQQALIEEYDQIVLAGFDFGGRDIYQPKSLPGENFKNQFKQILENDHRAERLFFLNLNFSLTSAFDKFQEVSKTKHHFQFSDSPGQRILLIGNGPSVLNAPLGAEIDKFDKVIRVNDWVTEGYEEFTGTKTDFWITGGSSRTIIKERDPSIQPIFLIPQDRWYGGENKLKKELTELFSSDMVSNSWFVDTLMFKRIVGLGGVARPSTGYASIILLSKLFNLKPFVLGFDFLSTGMKHYFKESSKPFFSPNHEWSKELSGFNKLVEEGFVRKLR